MKVLWRLGMPWRIWPFAAGNRLLVSVATGRPGGPKGNVLFASADGVKFAPIVDLMGCDPRATTTGQPFLTSRGTILVPAWDVDFYDKGATYCSIFRSGDGGSTWDKVFEDEDGTYANHFFESADGKHLFIGVGRGGGGRDGVIRFTPASSYLLKSKDDGRSWFTVLEYDKPSSLYQGVALTDDLVYVTTREQRSLVRLAMPSGAWREESFRTMTRCVEYVPELQRFVISGDGCIYTSTDTEAWERIIAPVRGPLRYPFFCDGMVYVATAQFPFSVLATDFKRWYMVHDFSRVVTSPVTRVAVLGDHIYTGSEFEGYFLKSPLPARRKTIGWSKRAALRVEESMRNGKLRMIRRVLSTVLPREEPAERAIDTVRDPVSYISGAGDALPRGRAK